MREITQLRYLPVVTYPDLSLSIWDDSTIRSVQLYVCSRCAVVVGSRDTHTAWHNAQATDGRG